MTGVVCTPLYAEWLALRAAHPVHTGRSRGAHLEGPTLIAGVAGALIEGIAPGDLVVATEIQHATRTTPGAEAADFRPGREGAGVRWGRSVSCDAAVLVAGELRRRGFTVHAGPVVTTDHVVDSAAERAGFAARGAVAVDTESGLLAGEGGRSVVVRVVVDTPGQPLRGIGMPWRGVRALLELRPTAGVINAWSAATGEREVLLAAPRSFCAGVERAIETVEQALERFGAPVYVRRQIVHNRHVVGDLERRGAVFVEEVDAVPEGSVLVLAAHGVAPTVRAQAAERHLRVIDATCPLVSKVHQEVRRYAGNDNTVVLIGHADHEEVVGTTGEAPDHVLVVSSPAEAATIQVPDPTRVAYAMQTTLAVEDASETAAVLRRRFPALKGPRTDDICYATSNRQAGLRAIARRSDLVIVLGSQNSSNSHRLVEVAEAAGTPAVLVDDAGELPLDRLAGANRIGITAGASAPPALVDELVRCLSGLGPITVTETGEPTEDVRFVLPREVTQP
ncbi:4-hydroxy-3-methylbut-2-enyl diphosphate reductase [Kribbella aluminosa]|uniref:4-hydroxy-3-methylbut-2-enyl diphosphate reductase n=1 Tax=Kribbella aluminosa TaxID=416017 RepID=A0ABS4UJX7_9ACTN|nr:4-hydroxy-3-methylbut-2-enyl diphosphate reductase [Kribbella aluminosa]MBP2351961.1 4-hydroxy-3-methylbut-2-enyl diphosphate reductase [Kribbella aluminosa]